MDCSKQGLSDEELGVWLACARLSTNGLRPALVRGLFDRMQSLSIAWKANADELESAGQLSPEAINLFLEKRRLVEPEEILQSVRASGVTALALPDPSYPLALRHISDPPLVLFVKGKLKEDDFHHAVGIVGTRRPTAYGSRLAKDIAAGLSQSGVVIVSGMAFGIDSHAHWGALSAGGRTLAVVGTGPDLCYPSSNRRLYEAILAEGRGAVISEYFPGTRPEKWHFPERNRIISGLSRALVVVEAGEVSGALITAKLAFEQNRDVFAVPGRVDSPMSRGTNKLISSTMAQLITGHEDILNLLQWVPTEPGFSAATLVELYGREKELYELLSNEPVHFDVLSERSNMPAGELSATLTMLELAGVVCRHPGDWYSRQYPDRPGFRLPSLPESQ